MKFVPGSTLAGRTAAALSFASLVLILASSDAAAVDTCRDWRVDRHPRLTADIDHDGRADIVGFGDAGVWTALAKGDGTFAAAKLVLGNFGFNQGWDPSKHVRLMADIHPGGTADIVAFGNDGVWTALAKGDGTFAPEKLVLANFGVNQGWTPSRHERLMADINHDGMADIVAFGNDGVWTALAKGDGTFAPEKLVLANFGVNQGWEPSKHVRLMADINHDGMADIVAFGNDGVWTALAKGDGTFAPEKLVLANFGVNQGWDPSKHARLMADINHDGRADIVAFGDYGVWTALAKGNGGFLPEKFVLANFGVNQRWDPSKHVRVMADINHDNMADIVAFGNDGVWTALAKGDGGFLPEKFVLGNFGANQGWDPSRHVRLAADISKDGRADIVAFGDAGVWTALADNDGAFAPEHLVLAGIFGCAARLDFNLEWSDADLNAFPVNPRWSWQREHPGVPDAGLCHHFSKTVLVDNAPVKVPDFGDCTDQTDLSQVDTPDGLNGFVCSLESSEGFHGHLNWFVTTFTGGLAWGDHNADDGYSMSLTTDGKPALINEDRKAMHTEFDSDETINNFGTPFWTAFHDAVDKSAAAPGQIADCTLHPPCSQATLDALAAAIARPRRLFTGRDGKPVESIVTGLFGVDCEHDGCKSELHPVYALAAHVKDDPNDDVWAIFVRNTGNEGYCSRRNWKADFTSYTFRLNWRPGMNGLSVLWGPHQTVFEGTAGTAGPAVNFVPYKGVDVTLILPPSQGPLINGELHLQWRGVVAESAGTSPTAAEVPLEKHDEAGSLRNALDKLPPAKWRQVRRAGAEGKKAVTLHPLATGAPASQVQELPPLPRVFSRLGTPGDVATRKLARDTARLRALCKAWNGSPPGLPADLCARAGP